MLEYFFVSVNNKNWNYLGKKTGTIPNYLIGTSQVEFIFKLDRSRSL